MNTAKTAIVTGASHGIGQMTALKLAAAGYDLAICCQKDMTALSAVAKQITANGRNCLAMQCDVGDSAQVADFFSQIQITYPHIDLLINNAGISYVGLLQDMSDDEWTAIVNSNLSSVFYNCRAAIPTMLAQQYGKIINITSVWGEIGASTEVAYSATKGGVCAFTKALAKELGPSHITVNAVSCGFIDTRMNGQLSDDERSSLFEEIPVGRPASAEETADFIVQVAQSGEYLTGQVLRFDGGWI